MPAFYRRLLFPALPLACIIMNANRRAKTGEAWERGYGMVSLQYIIPSVAALQSVSELQYVYAEISMVYVSESR